MNALTQGLLGSSPTWRAKFFKDFQALDSMRMRVSRESVGTFVGMLFHNAAFR
jgi:hypothetical protein